MRPLPLLLAAAALLAVPPLRAAVVVTAAPAGSPAAAAGLEPGDLVAGELRRDGLDEWTSRWDLSRFVERNAGGRLLLTFRGPEERVVRLGPGDPSLRVGPVAPAIRREAWDEFTRLAKAKDAERQAAAGERLACDPALSSELRATVALDAAWGARGPRRENLVLRLLDVARAAAAERPEVARFATMRVALTLFDIGRFEEALATYRQALAAHRAAVGESLSGADALNQIGILLSRLGDPDGSIRAFEEALAVTTEVAPGTLDQAYSLNNLAIAIEATGRHAEAERLQRRALAIKERVAPGSRGVMSSLVALGELAALRGDLAGATRWYERAVATAETSESAAWDLDKALEGLAAVDLDRGDLASAEARHARALAIRRERHGERNSFVAGSLAGLAEVARERGDLAEAERLLGEALSVHRYLAPCSEDVASTLADLAAIASRDARPDDARLLLDEAIGIVQAAAPGSSLASSARARRAREARLAGRLPEANAGAVAAFLRQQAGGFPLGAQGSRLELARIAVAAGEPVVAEEWLREAAEALEAVAPASPLAFEVRLELARLLDRSGRGADAAPEYGRAVAILESLGARLGDSPEVRAEWRASHLDALREATDLSLRLRRDDEAFVLAERGRARELAALLAEREIAFDADLPPALEAERRELLAARRRFVEGTDGSDAPPGDSAVDLERRWKELQQRIRAASPRVAALSYPAPAGVAEARGLLGPRDLLAAWQVGEAQTILFVVDAGGLAVARLPVGRAALSRSVDRVVRLVSEPGAGPLPPAARPLLARLSDQIFGPLAGRVAAADRLRFLPDGPLHRLPFSVLAEPGGGPFRHLVEGHALALAPSISALLELRARRAAPGAPRLVALGDPVLPDGEVGGPAWRDRLGPLPAAREEVAALGRIWGDAATTLVGAEASECALRGAAPAATRLHFACHALANERHPLGSALLLSAGETAAATDDDGRLEAWEIFEQIRVEADLVALSACRTALGENIDGEGFVGLTRAFLHAGARSVVASLWNVADESTARLMAGLHARLADGQLKDEALRAAQLELLQGGGPDSAPASWAPFVLTGDWR